MSATLINEFLLSLASAIAAATSPSLSPALSLGAAPRSMWVNDAIEGQTTETYTVLRCYRGNEPGAFAGARVTSVAVQLDTRGKDALKVMKQAWAAHEALLDSDGRPRMHWAIAGKKYNATTEAIEADSDGSWNIRTVRFISGPGIIGRDGERSIATSNFDVDFDRV